MSENRPALGFVGVGAMGLPMALNLLRAGYQLAFCTRRDGAAEMLAAAGGVRLEDPVAVAGQSDVLLTCLPADAEVEAVLLDPDGALAALHPGDTIIELSTIAPATVRRVADAAAARGIAVLDAPISGGTSGAEAGTLAIMVGGEAEAFAACGPIFQVLGRQITHVGPVGMGKTFKLCNQYLVGATTALVGEALTMAARAGADLPLLVEVLSASSGASRALGGAAPNLLAAEPTPVGFRLDLMRKDLGLALALGAEMRTPLATGAVAYQLYGAASASGMGDRNFSELGLLLARLAGVDLAQRGEATT